MRYVVLRRPSQSERSDRQPIRDLGGSGRWWRTESPARELHIDVETTDAKGRQDIERDPEVVAIAPSMPTRLIEPLVIASQGNADDSWGIAAVGATTSKYTGANTTVAVLDTGIDATHPAFVGIGITEEDFSGSGNGDRKGHGTHCAGIICGRDVRGSRIGIARGVERLLVGKVLSDTGSGSSEMIFHGLRWAAERRAHVISMSLGFDFPGMVRDRVQDGWPTDLATSFALEAYRGNLRMFDALMAMIKAQEYFSPGCVVVAAAGNESMKDVNPNYVIAASLPAAAESVLSTGALLRGTNGYAMAPFSNSYAKLCAPGVDIRSAYPGGHMQTMSGTSMACPHVAGVAALWWEAARDRGLPEKASTVASHILGACRLDCLAPDVDIADRGSGLVTAPS